MQLYDKDRTDELLATKLADAPSDGSTYGRLNGAWSVVGGGGSVAWGAITGTLSSQADLQSALDGKLAASSVNDVSTSLPYTLALSDANNVVYILSQNYVTVYIPEDSAVNFPVGTTVRLTMNNCSYITVAVGNYGTAPAINNSNTNSVTFLMSNGAYVANLVKVAADSWVVA